MFAIFIFFFVFIICFAGLDDKMDRYYIEYRCHAAINAYHDDIQRQLAITKTEVELLETQTKLNKLTTTI
jgi:hypothetical protein